jgi:tetratricopeptide (TPR) repeat protein
MRRLGLVVCVFVYVGLVVACGPKKPNAAQQLAAARASAQARVLEGCYACLLEARTTYAGVAVGRARASLIVPMFEVELLLNLREREFAMDSSDSLARAKALIRELPAGVDGARYLAAVEAVPPDAMGVPQSEGRAYRQGQLAYRPRINDEVAWLETGPLQPAVRRYLALSIDCEYSGRPRGSLTALPGIDQPAPPGTPPLVVYRLATCDHINTVALEQLEAQVPAFVEGSAFRARLEVNRAQQTGGTLARTLLAAAYTGLPKSSSVTYLNGNFGQTIGDCRAALRFYDETLAMRPSHENALLGRTVCLVFLNRQDEAITTATQMIDMRTYNIADAYFWRAWIHHERRELPVARQDINLAKTLASNNNIHRLAGIIEHDQDDLDIAEKDLAAAKTLSGGQQDCVARWYLALVAVKRERWTVSAGHFEDAMRCYDNAAMLSELALQHMEANTEIDPDFKARQIEGFRAAIKSDRTQYHAAAFNAANHFAREGNLDKARPLLDIAARDPALEKPVAELRKIIGGG